MTLGAELAPRRHVRLEIRRRSKLCAARSGPASLAR